MRGRRLGAAVLAAASLLACINFEEAQQAGCLAQPALCPADGGPDGGGNPGPTVTLTLNNMEPSFSLTGTVDDPDGVLDVVINWGDATPDLNIPANLVAISLNEGHQYTAAGTYNVTVTARDALFGSSSQNYSAIVNVPSSGLLFHYRFNGDLLDSSANGYTLTYGGQGFSEVDGYVADRASTAASAFKFEPDEVANEYSYATSAAVPTVDVSQSFTVALWVKTASGNGDQGTLLSQDDNWELRFNNGNRPRIVLGPNSSSIVVEDNTQLAHNVWHHVAFVKAGSTVRIYVNNIEVHSQSIAAVTNGCSGVALIVNGSNANLACEDLPSGAGYTGHTMDDIRMYSRDLSPAELTLVYNAAP